jgi:hypothetical protein
VGIFTVKAGVGDIILVCHLGRKLTLKPSCEVVSSAISCLQLPGVQSIWQAWRGCNDERRDGGCDEHPLRCVVSAALAEMRRAGMDNDGNPIDHSARLEEGPGVQDSEVRDAHIDGDSDDEVRLQFNIHHTLF